MASTAPRNPLKITVHPDIDGTFSFGGWPININQESERVDIERGNKCYSIVFTPEGPILEIWNVDDSGELDGLDRTIHLPK